MTSVPISVRDCRSGEATLTWGQRSILRIITMLGDDAHTINAGTWAACPPGTDIPAALAMIRRMLVRHESFRTRYVPRGDDRVQVLDGGGAVEVEVVPLDGAELDELAEHVRVRLRRTLFALADEWPVRFALVVEGDAVRAVVFVGSHAVCDGWALRELRNQLAQPDPAQDGDPGVQPLDQAAFEASPAGIAVDERAMTYWRRQLTRMPQTLFPQPPGPAHDHRFWYARFESPILSGALPMLARRYSTSTSAVLFAATAAVLAGNAGLETLAMGTVAGNRFRPGTRVAIGTLSQLVLITLPVAGRSFEELVRGAMVGSVDAYRHGGYDLRSLARVTDEVSAERGVCLDMSMWFNDRRLAVPTPPGPTSGAVPAERGKVRWVTYNDEGDSKFYLYVDGTHDAVSLYLMTDTRYLAPTTTEQVLAEIEDVLVDAVARTDASGGPVAVPAGSSWCPAGDGWHRIDSSWVELASVRRLLDAAGEWAAAGVFVDDGRIVAYLVPVSASDGVPSGVPAGEGGPSADEVHARCLAAVPDHPAAIAPHHYTFCAAPPADGDDLAAWRRQHATSAIARTAGGPPP
jgi:hypothetical protein